MLWNIRGRPPASDYGKSKICMAKRKATAFSSSTVQATVTDSFLAKLESLKADVVTLLSQCESAGKSEKDALVTFDPDKSGKARNIPSFGILQFKVPTGA